MRKLDVIRGAFKIEQRNLKQLATLKAQRMMSTMFEDMKKLFTMEYAHIVEGYNRMRYQLGKLEKKVAVTETTNQVLEKLNSEKDTFYDHLPIRFIDVTEDLDLEDPSNVHLSEQQVTDANMLLNQAFSFYGGYASLSANAKEQICESQVLAQLLQKITDLKEECYQKDGLLEAANKTTAILIENSEKDMQTIYNLNDEIKKLNLQIQKDQETHTKVKRQLYDDFQKENKKLKKQNKIYRGLSALEMRAQEVII